jgi:exopolysaccharide biosynthesis polyprenyl glycosylphosphotransferase
MQNNISLLYSFALIVGDAIAILAAFVIAYILRVDFDNRPLATVISARDFITTFFWLTPGFIAVLALLGLYRKDTYSRKFAEAGRLLVGSGIGILGLIGFDYFSNKELFPARLIPVYGFFLIFFLLVIERSTLQFIRKKLFTYGIGLTKLLIIGSAEETFHLARLLMNTSKSGYKIVGVVAHEKYVPDALKDVRLNTVEQALERITQANMIVQTELYSSESTNERILETAQKNHVAYRFLPRLSLYAAKNQLELFHNYPIIAVHPTALIGWGRVGKRIFDIVCATLGLVVSLPVFVVVGSIIKITDSAGPVFYKHKRITRFGEEFYVYKLRSFFFKYSTGKGKKTDIELFTEMGREDLVSEWEATQKVKNDPRVMPIGKFIRKTSIDELPQLLNVLQGKLSLIGPRPVTKGELSKYKEASSLFLSVKPGITGLWQVSGRNDLSYDERVKLDLFYVQHWSPSLDLKILYRTIIVMVTGKGN